MKKLSQNDQILFAKRLGFLIRAGVPIAESLAILKGQVSSKSNVKIFKKILDDVSGGQFLSSAMDNLKSVFSEFAINIVRVGEEGGSLAENLHYLSEEMKKRRALKKKVIGALIYPVFIAVATLGITLALTLLVFPKVLPIFASMKATLPLSTRMLMFFSKNIIHYSWLIILLVSLAAIAFIILFQYKKAKYFFHALSVRVPVFGPLIRHYYLANFCRTLGLLLKNHSKIDQGLIVAARTCPNLVYQNQFEQMALTVRAGGKISAYTLSRLKLFPEMFGHTLAVGETAGNLSETFLFIAQNYEQEVDDLSKNLSDLIEPFLMILMGLLVGFVAMSIILPIYSVTEKLKL